MHQAENGAKKGKQPTPFLGTFHSFRNPFSQSEMFNRHRSSKEVQGSKVVRND